MNRVGLLLLIITVIFSAGCESMGENTKKGAGLGALAGAAIGGIVGHQSHHAWEGVLIGAAAGGAAGGVIGNQVDKKQTTTDNPRYISLTQVAQMEKDGLPDDVIISELKQANARFEMSADVIEYLKANGVSDKVINYMVSVSE